MQAAIIVLDKADMDGKRLCIMIGSGTKEFKAYEPILRRMVASVKIAPEQPAVPAGPEKPADLAAPADKP